MIITCQNCQTHYSVNADAIGGGKAVRCANCGNSWHQNPVAPMAPPPAPYPPQPAYAAPAPYPPAPAPMAAPPPPPPAPEPAPPPMPEPPPPEPEPVPEPEAIPEPEAMPEPEPEAIDEPAPDMSADPEGDAMAEAEATEAGEEEGLSPEELDQMFGDDTGSDAFQSLGDSGDAAEDGEFDDPDTLPDPEPIPQVFSPDGDEDLDADIGKGGKGKFIAIVAAVLLVVLGTGGGAYFAKGLIIDMWPGAAGIYEMVGLGGEELGAGLDIRNIKSSRDIEGGVDVLVVRGTVVNLSEKDRKVPMIRVALLDGNKNEVQFVVAAPLKNRLPAGAEIGFSAKVAEPSPLARRVEVAFTEDQKTGG